MARRNDDLNGIVGREIQRAVWGNEHPYARNTEYATLEAITRDDVVGFYEYFYHPDNMYIAVWGDFDPAQMLAALEARFPEAFESVDAAVEKRQVIRKSLNDDPEFQARNKAVVDAGKAIKGYELNAAPDLAQLAANAKAYIDSLKSSKAR